MKIKVDRNLCRGLGYCVAVAPTVFKLDKEGKAVVLNAASVDDDTIMEAAQSCPEDAIILADESGNQVYP